jgi:hypothetical protein
MEPNNTFATASRVTAADTGPAAICDTEDHDFYRFTAISTTVAVAIKFKIHPGGNLDIRLWQTASTLAAQSRNFGDDELIVCPESVPSCQMLTIGEDYVLEVFPASVGSINAYTLSILP